MSFKSIFIVLREADIVGVFERCTDAFVHAWSSAFNNWNLLHSVHSWDVSTNRQTSQTDLMCERVMATMEPGQLDAIRDELLQTRTVPRALTDYMEYHRYV